MTSLHWRPLGAVDPLALGEARHQAHNAVQWLARMARSYAEPAPGDAHTATHWDAEHDALVTTEVGPGLTLEFRIPELALQFLESGKRVTHVLPLDERSSAETEAWFLVEMLHRGIDRSKFSKDLPYEIPDMMSGDAEDYSIVDREAALKELADWFANAAVLLEAVRDETAALKPGPSPVVCWPHHFDMATLITLGEGDAETAQSIGVGLSPGDEHYDEPYFYVTPWPRPSPWELPDLPDLGHWHKKGFIGAVVPGSRLLERGAGGEDVLEFVRAALKINRELLAA